MLRALSIVAVAGTAAAAMPLRAQIVDLPARDVALQPRLEDLYRVGRPEGPEWELYGSQVRVAFDVTGRLHVFDPQNHRVVVVGGNGRLVRVVGKRGEGPGELRNPVGFAVLRDGTIAIADLAQRSFVIYDPSGAYQGSTSFAFGGLAAIGELHADPRGGALVSVGQTTVITQAAGDGPTQVVRGAAAGAAHGGRTIVRYPLVSGGVAREIHRGWQPPRPETPIEPAEPRRGGTVPPRARAFEPQLHAAVLPDGGLVVSDSSSYALDLISPDGGVRLTLRRPLRPQPVTPAMQRRERDRRFEQLTGGGATLQLGRGGGAPLSQEQVEQLLRQNLEQLQFYPELPVIAKLAADWTGRVWVARTAANGGGYGAVDVIAAGGEYVGTIPPDGPRLPDAFGPDGLVAYVERDALDVVSVSVRRLPANLR